MTGIIIIFMVIIFTNTKTEFKLELKRRDRSNGFRRVVTKGGRPFFTREDKLNAAGGLLGVLLFPQWVRSAAFLRFCYFLKS